MTFKVEVEQEQDGRWIAEVVELPGVMAYGTAVQEARARVQALALRVVAGRPERDEAGPDLVSISLLLNSLTLEARRRVAKSA